MASFFDSVNSGDVEAVKAALKADPSLANSKDEKYGAPMLNFAANNKNAEMVKVLLENGAEVNGINQKDQTALHFAAFKGDQEIVDMLIKAGADANMKNDAGETPADVAKRMGHNDIDLTPKPVEAPSKGADEGLNGPANPAGKGSKNVDDGISSGAGDFSGDNGVGSGGDFGGEEKKPKTVTQDQAMEAVGVLKGVSVGGISEDEKPMAKDATKTIDTFLTEKLDDALAAGNKEEIKATLEMIKQNARAQGALEVAGDSVGGNAKAEEVAKDVPTVTDAQYAEAMGVLKGLSVNGITGDERPVAKEAMQAIENYLTQQLENPDLPEEQRKQYLEQLKQVAKAEGAMAEQDARGPVKGKEQEQEQEQGLDKEEEKKKKEGKTTGETLMEQAQKSGDPLMMFVAGLVTMFENMTGKKDENIVVKPELQLEDTSKPPVENTIPDTSKPPVENTIPDTSKPPVENAIPDTSKPPVENTIPDTSKPPVENTIPDTSKPPVENTIPDTSKPPVSQNAPEAPSTGQTKEELDRAMGAEPGGSLGAKEQAAVKEGQQRAAAEAILKGVQDKLAPYQDILKQDTTLNSLDAASKAEDAAKNAQNPTVKDSLNQSADTAKDAAGKSALDTGSKLIDQAAKDLGISGLADFVKNMPKAVDDPKAPIKGGEKLGLQSAPTVGGGAPEQQVSVTK